ncbi:MAG: hypothetical protein HY707_01020 [Ignavibacteriae bacterium]|nr:hypothetical protein [Ignavibacteriota bacterium]
MIHLINRLPTLGICLVLTSQWIAYGQACCSSGTPLLSFAELGTTRPSTIQFNIGYEYNYLNSVFNGSAEYLNDARRQRRVHSLLFETSYGISSRLSITTLLSFTQRERQSVLLETGTPEIVQTRGVSDAILLVKYALLTSTIVSQQELSIGSGITMPFGSIGAELNGIKLPSDMQLGSGAWDGILLLVGSSGFHPFPLTLFGSLSDRLTTKNADGYRFGNEFLAILGASYSFASWIDLTLSSRFRHTGVDRFQDQEVPNTGGDWLYLVPGINVTPWRSVTLRAHLDLPVYRNLEGSQLTTTYVTGLNLFYSINLE